MRSTQSTDTWGDVRVLFNSLTFVAFFVVVVVLHYAPLPWWLK